MVKSLLTALLLTILAGCNMQQDIDIDMPPYKSELVAECYLVPGQKFQLMLTETVPYISNPDTPTVSGARVIISYGNIRDTLQETHRGHYEHDDIVPPDYETTFHLSVKDLKGREISGETRICKPVEIDSVKFLFSKENKAQCMVYFADPPTDKDYYTLFMLMHDNHWEYFDDSKYDGKGLPYMSGFFLEEGQKFNLVLTHINRDAYEFVQTGKVAYSSNLRPLNEPAQIKVNVEGGLGIFTGFYPSYQEMTVFR